jgi:stage II sporulation protein D
VRKILVNDNEQYGISGEEVRRIFNLRSARFHVFDSGGLLFVEGEGFGHGVGMCQDGAYFLSEMGLDYEKIIKHYYQGVRITTVNQIPGL